MTPIGSTSSNIRRAIDFMARSSCCSPGVRANAHHHLDDWWPRNSSTTKRRSLGVRLNGLFGRELRPKVKEHREDLFGCGHDTEVAFVGTDAKLRVGEPRRE